MKIIQPSGRTRMNFMIDNSLILQLKTHISKGEWSDFVNVELSEGILQYKREKASKAMDELRKRAKLKLSDAEIIRLKNYGRE